MITIYSLAYNEELLIQFMIDHYKERFPSCKIIIYDHMSTDKTVEIAKLNNCEVRTFDTGGKIDDNKYIEIKNSCWKTATTDWVLVCDIDELIDITEGQLKKEETIGTTIIKTEGYNMINVENNCDFYNMKNGVRQIKFDKSCLFNKKFINNINYIHGCHECRPIGIIKNSSISYKLYHYKYINIDWLIDKHKKYAERLSDINKKYKWGIEYLNNEKDIKNHFVCLQKNSVKVR
ncbi:MAG: glycosyltransferase family 2 protein [Bacteroidia bacterium]